MALECVYGCSDGRSESGSGEDVSFLKMGREWRLLGLLYADVLVLCVESVEDLKVMVGCFAEVCRRGLKVNADKVLMLGFKYLRVCFG